MRTPRWSARPAVTILAAAAAALVALPASGPGASLAAQIDREADACRCVDRDGNPIENCTCFRTPRPLAGGAFAWTLPDLRSRARLGLTVTTDQGADDDGRGARIVSLLDAGPAADAGLREGDVVTALDGHPLLEPLEADVEADFDLDRSVPVQRLLALARDLEAGRDVEVRYLRDGEERTTTLTTEDLDAWGLVSWRDGERPGLERGFRLALPGRDRRGVRGAPDLDMRRLEPGRRFLVEPDDRFATCPGEADAGWPTHAFGGGCPGGLELLELNPGLAGYFGTDGGVLVANVHPDAPLPLEPGDVIVRVGDRRADSPDRVRRILRSYEADEPIRFEIVRRERTLTVEGRLGG